VKSDMSVPVIRTSMPDEDYAAFKTEEHLTNLKQYNPIFSQHLFEIHKCYRQQQPLRGRTLLIKTSEEVVKYLMDLDFVVPYPSGEVQFQREINWTAAKSVCTLPVIDAPPPVKPPVKPQGLGKKPQGSKPSEAAAKAPSVRPDDRSGRPQQQAMTDGNSTGQPLGGAAAAQGKPAAPRPEVMVNKPRSDGGKGKSQAGPSGAQNSRPKGANRESTPVKDDDRVATPEQSGQVEGRLPDDPDDRQSNSQQLDAVLKEWDDLLKDRPDSPMVAVEGRAPEPTNQDGLQLLATAAAQVGQVAEEQPDQDETLKPHDTVYESAMGSDLSMEQEAEDEEAFRALNMEDGEIQDQDEESMDLAL